MHKQKLDPPSRTDTLRVVALRLPEPIIALIDRIGTRQIRSRSDVLRALAIEALQHRGLVKHGAPILDEVAA